MTQESDTPFQSQPHNPSFNQTPDTQGITPEQYVGVENAVGAIASMGAAAVSETVQAPDELAKKGGFLSSAAARIKGGIQRAWNEAPVVKAITEAGGSFSKWEVAKVIGRYTFLDTPINAALGLSGQYGAMNRRVDLINAGGTSKTLQRKMAAGLPDSRGDRDNPIQKHLQHRKTPEAVTQAVEIMRDRMEWERENPDKVIQNRVTYLCLGAIAASATWAAYKGLIDHESVSAVRDMSSGRK